MEGREEALGKLQRIAAAVCEDEEVSAEEVRAELAACIDETLLDPMRGPAFAGEWARERACEGLASLCVQPCNVERVASMLAEEGSPTPVCTVLAFPQGQLTGEEVAFQTAYLLALGASEFDLVMNVGAFLEGDLGAVAEPIVAMVQTAYADIDEEAGEEGACACEHDGCDECNGECCDHDQDHDHCAHDHCDDGHRDDGYCDHGHCDHEHEGGLPVLKVILETGCLTAEQVCAAADFVSSLGVDFVKTSTGFGPRGATVDDVRLMCACVEPGVQVKAAGGIRTLDDALALIEAGATRLGTSHGMDILAEFDALVRIAEGGEA